ncbi:MAG TPA: hypothetical protein VJK71_08960 [Gemmatimonadales bacterium]|nr:hypothetical protein [Gemmatimonadales bacterium]
MGIQRSSGREGAVLWRNTLRVGILGGPSRRPSPADARSWSPAGGEIFYRNGNRALAAAVQSTRDGA